MLRVCGCKLPSSSLKGSHDQGRALMKAYRSTAYLFLSSSLAFFTFPFFSAARSAVALALFTVTVDSVQEGGRLVLRGVLNDGC